MPGISRAELLTTETWSSTRTPSVGGEVEAWELIVTRRGLDVGTDDCITSSTVSPATFHEYNNTLYFGLQLTRLPSTPFPDCGFPQLKQTSQVRASKQLSEPSDLCRASSASLLAYKHTWRFIYRRDIHPTQL